MKPYFLSTFFTALCLLDSMSLRAVEFEVAIQLNQAPAILELSDASGSKDNSVHFGPFGAEFRGTGNDGRNFLRTVGNGFGQTDFEASVVWNGSGQMFFGIGEGDLGAYGTPDWQVERNDSVWLEMLPNGGSSISRIVGGERIEMPKPFQKNRMVNRPIRVVWRYQADSRTITFSADNDYSGTAFMADLKSSPIPIDELFDPNESFRIYFGGEGGNISEAKIHYIPEPNAFAVTLGLCGFLLTLRRRGRP
jgi:hypothetical protein